MKFSLVSILSTILLLPVVAATDCPCWTDAYFEEVANNVVLGPGETVDALFRSFEPASWSPTGYVCRDQVNDRHIFINEEVYNKCMDDLLILEDRVGANLCQPADRGNEAEKCPCWENGLPDGQMFSEFYISNFAYFQRVDVRIKNDNLGPDDLDSVGVQSHRDGTHICFFRINGIPRFRSQRIPTTVAEYNKCYNDLLLKSALEVEESACSAKSGIKGDGCPCWNDAYLEQVASYFVLGSDNFQVTFDVHSPTINSASIGHGGSPYQISVQKNPIYSTGYQCQDKANNAYLRILEEDYHKCLDDILVMEDRLGADLCQPADQGNEAEECPCWVDGIPSSGISHEGFSSNRFDLKSILVALDSGDQLQTYVGRNADGSLNPRCFSSIGGIRTNGQETITVPEFNKCYNDLLLKSCQEEVNVCSITSGIKGDPHVHSWSGQWFDYMGECDLVLAHVPDFDNTGSDLNIFVRTTIRYDYSYIESAALQIGNSTLEVDSWGQHFLNGVESAKLEGIGANSHLSNYPIYYQEINEKQHQFDVVIDKVTNITISSFKDIVAVSITDGSHHHFAHAVGLMGSRSGKLLARDGITELGTDLSAFGQEWQVHSDEPQLFSTVRSPQHPKESCILPTDKTTERRRLGGTISRSSAERACAHVSHDGQKYESCINDVIALGDLDFAMTY